MGTDLAEARMDFVGKATPLSVLGVERVRDRIHIGLPELWAVVRIETRGCGFLADRRPKLLFERHIFHRETAGRFDAQAPDLSQPSAGGCGAGGANQYVRLARAIALDRRAALRSASWGMGQVMGFNAESVGFTAVEQMVSAMCDAEDAQLDAVAGFIDANRLGAVLGRHDWPAFAAAYNGPDYATNDYDEKLRNAYTYFRDRGLPDIRLRTAQVLLLFAGFDPGPVDGEMGVRTAGALREFQQSKGLATSGQLDDATFAALGGA